MLKIRELREEKKLTQQEMADKFSVSRQVFANWENEINQPDLKIIVLLSNFFGVSTDYLLGRTDDFGTVISPSAQQLSEAERKLLSLYRSMTDPQRIRFVSFGEGLTSLNSKKNRV